MNDPSLLIAPHLSSGEKLLWGGRPRQGVILRPQDGFMIPFSILWGGFALFWEYGVITSGAPFFFCLFGVPFVVVGIHIMVGRFFFDARMRAYTVYAVTSERILIITGSKNLAIKSLGLRTVSDVTLNERSDKSGTIMFGNMSPQYAFFQGSGTYWPGVPEIPAFVMIPNAKLVYDAIQSAKRSNDKS